MQFLCVKAQSHADKDCIYSPSSGGPNARSILCVEPRPTPTPFSYPKPPDVCLRTQGVGSMVLPVTGLTSGEAEEAEAGGDAKRAKEE